jgi:hypothetical protein
VKKKKTMKTLLPAALFALLAIPFPLAAQEFGFGFGDDADAPDSEFSAPPFAVSVSGKVGMELLGYVNELDEPADATLDGNFRGALNFEAEGPNAKAVIHLDVNPPSKKYISGWVSIDEAYLQAYFGDFELGGGLRKLTWGKADSMGPLDVINPYDYSNLTTLTDVMEMKVAQPLIHGSYRVGSFSKIEAVILPWFSPHRFAEGEDRWAPPMPSAPPPFKVTVNLPDTDGLSTLDYFQAGARFTTTIGSADIGAQYFYGRMYQPAQRFTVDSSIPNPTITIDNDYNRYHQIGIDYAQVIADFNIRAEAAANITEDLSGDDGEVYNPSIAWSLGFDRDLVWGINLNLQCNESIRLMNDEVSDDPLLDTEAGKDITSTLITAALSKKFLRDELELKTSAVWDIENGAALIMPAIVWTKNDVALELSGGIFAGSDEGLFGQFHDNSFIKVGLKYTF